MAKGKKVAKVKALPKTKAKQLAAAQSSIALSAWRRLDEVRRQGIDDATYGSVLDALANGAPLSAICDRPGMPSARMVLERARVDPAFGADMQLARQLLADRLAEETIRIADEEENATPADKIKARQWLASKIRPDVYGNTPAVQSTGPITIQWASNEGACQVTIPQVVETTRECDEDF